jgi:8-oxo-dGTP pyrophosphatase MutT (NUDIX family)
MKNVIDKLAWIEIQNRQVLGARSKNKTKFYIPGGKREEGETDLDTLVREIKEELSVDLRPESLAFLGEFQAQADSQPWGVEVKMRCYFADYQGEIKASAEIEELTWLSYQDRPNLAPVDQIIFDTLKKIDLID